MVNAAKKDDLDRAQMRQDAEDADLRGIMSEAHGRRFVWRELGRCGLHAQTYSPNNSEHCFRAGERNAAIRLQADIIRVCPELYLEMQHEAIAAEKREAERLKALDTRGNEHDD